MPPRTMKLLLGGKWPKTTGFNYNSVREFRFESGVWQPYGPYGEILPGPALEITASEVDAWGTVIGAAEKDPE